MCAHAHALPTVPMQGSDECPLVLRAIHAADWQLLRGALDEGTASAQMQPVAGTHQRQGHLPVHVGWPQASAREV